eukprot:1157455-Pelagomonas_calceolata.AAC.1
MINHHSAFIEFAVPQELVARRHGSGVAPLKVILMSATLDAEAFGDYFGGCPGFSLKMMVMSGLKQVEVDNAFEVLPFSTLDLHTVMLVCKQGPNSSSKTTQEFVVLGPQSFGSNTLLILCAAVLTAEGRTFPVEALFLEDVYYATGYRLAPDAPAAMRSGGARANANAMRKQAGGGSSIRRKRREGILLGMDFPSFELRWGMVDPGFGRLMPMYT